MLNTRVIIQLQEVSAQTMVCLFNYSNLWCDLTIDRH